MSTRPLWTLDQVVAWVREHPGFAWKAMDLLDQRRRFRHEPAADGSFVLLVAPFVDTPERMLAGLFSHAGDKEPEGVCEAKMLPEALREVAFHREVKKMSVH